MKKLAPKTIVLETTEENFDKLLKEILNLKIFFYIHISTPTKKPQSKLIHAGELKCKPN